MITVRAMTIDDYDGVYGLWTSVPGIGLNHSDDSADGLAKYIARNPGTSFVAEDGGTIIGAVLAGHDGRRGFLYHAAILPSHRKRGIAKQLIALALDALKREGINKVGLLAFSKNEEGNSFWKSMGFGARDDCTYRDKVIGEITYNPNPYLGQENK